MAEEPGDTFNFYLKFAKPLVLGLQDPSDRITAAAWIQKLRDVNLAEESIRNDYLKLLLFVLHRGKLCGPFLENPTHLETLDKFPTDFKILDVARDILVQDEKDRRHRLVRGLGASGDYPPYSTECSADLLEYAAAQDIPKFGVHAYYAISFEPISKWDNSEKAQYPRAIAEMMEKSARIVSSAPAIEASPPTPAIALNKSASVPKPPSPKLAAGVNPKTTKSKNLKPRPRTPVTPISPIDNEPRPAIPRVEITEPDAPGRTEQHFESRSPITWGSNLIDVNDPPERDLDFPDGEIDDFLFEEPPSDFSSVISGHSSQEMNSSRAKSSSRDFNMSAASLPYRTPPRPPSSPTSPASLPYRTPPRMDGSPFSSPMSAASLPYRTPQGRSPMSPASLPYRTPPRLDNSIEIPAGSPISKELIEEANMTLHAQSAGESDEAADIPLNAFDDLYPEKRSDMPRTPPMFSKFKEIREGPGRTASYPPQMFGLTGEEQWQSGANFQFERGGKSPSNRMQYRPPQKPINEVFPGIKQTDDWSSSFFDAENIDLVDDEFEHASGMDADICSAPKENYDNQIKDLLGLLHERKVESPAGAGVTATTPKSSPSPRRTKPYGSDFPIFLEDMPTYSSPEHLSPTATSHLGRSPSQSRHSPATPSRPPSPVRDPNTDSFGLPIPRSHGSPIKPPTPKANTPRPSSPKPKTPVPSTSASKKTSIAKISSEVQTTSETPSAANASVKGAEAVNTTKDEEIQNAEDSQYAALYDALLGEAKKPSPPKFKCDNKSVPRTPDRGSPHSPQAPPPENLMGVAGQVNYSPTGHYMDEELPEGLQSPIRGPTVLHGWQTPPHLKVQQQKTPSPYNPVHARNMNNMLDFQSFPYDDYHEHPETPPTPPRQFTYDEYADPFQRSPEELDVNFGGEEEEYGLTDMLEAHEYVPYRENPVTNVQVGHRRIGVHKARKDQRRPDTISESPEHLMLPSPERADLRTLDTSRMGRTPSPVVTAQDQNLLNFAEEHFVHEFDNPQQQDMLRRVIRLIDDVEGEPLYQDPEILYAEIASELPGVSEQQDPMMISPPREIDDIDDIEQLEAAQLRVPSPEPELEYPGYDFQGPVSDFMPQQEQYQLPIQQTSPRRKFSQPSSPQPTDADFHQFQQMTQQCSPCTLEDSPVHLVESPSPDRGRSPRRSPGSPPTPHIADFIMESIQRDPEPYSDVPMTLRQGTVGNKFTKLSRHSRNKVDLMGSIREVPPDYDEDLGDFNYNVDRARETYPWAPYVRAPKMQKPNIMSPVDEGYEFDSPVAPAGRPRITKKMVRKRLNFSSEDPDPRSPEPPKVVDMPTEPISRIPDQPLPSPRRKCSPRVIYAVGSPIRLDDQLNVMDDDRISPTSKAVQRLTRRHQDLLEGDELPMPADLMGMNAPTTYCSPTHLMDEGISDFLPSPGMRLPVQVPGWKTPPNLAAAPTCQISPALPPVFANVGDELESEFPPLDYELSPSAQQEEHMESSLTTGSPYFMDAEQMEWPTSPTSPMEDTRPSCYMQNSSPKHSHPRMKKTTSKTIIMSPHMKKTTETYKTEPEYSPESSPDSFQDYRGPHDYLFSTPNKNKDLFKSSQPMTSSMAKILSRSLTPLPSGERRNVPSPGQYMQSAAQSPYNAVQGSPRTSQGTASPKSPYRTPPRSAWDEREDGGLLDENLPDLPSDSPYSEENEVIEEVHPDKTTKKTHIKKISPGMSKEYDYFEVITDNERQPNKQQPYSCLASADEYKSPKVDTSGNFIDSQVPMMERVEHLIADIPGGSTPPRPSSPYVPDEYTSPNWSPGLPIAPGSCQLDQEQLPMEQFQSPKSPMQRSPQGRSPQGRSSQVRSPQSRTPQGRQSPRPIPNILAMSPETLGVAPLGDENFPDMMSPETSPRQSPARFSPNFIPPRSSPPPCQPPRSPSAPCQPPRRQSQKYSPEPTYPDPNDIRQELESHQYTQHQFDRNRNLMRKYVRSGNKMVPLSKGAGRPRLGIIADMEEPLDSPKSPEAFPMDAFNISPPARSPPVVEWVSPPNVDEGRHSRTPYSNYSVTPPKVNYDGYFGDESIYSSPPVDLYVSPESIFSSQADNQNMGWNESPPDWEQSPQYSPKSPCGKTSPCSPAFAQYSPGSARNKDIMWSESPPQFANSPQYSPGHSPPQSPRCNIPTSNDTCGGPCSFQTPKSRRSIAPTADEVMAHGSHFHDIGEVISFDQSPRRVSPLQQPMSAPYDETPKQVIYPNTYKGRRQGMTKRRRLDFDGGPPDSPPSAAMYDTARAPSPTYSPRRMSGDNSPRQPQMSPRQTCPTHCGSPGPSQQEQSRHYSPQPGSSGAAHMGGTPTSHRSPNRTEVIDETITYSPSGQPKSITKKTTKESPNDSFMEYEFKVFDDDYESGILDTSDIPNYGSDDEGGFGWMD